MAFLYSTLLQLRHNYTELVSSQVLKYCSPLASVILADINKRFEDYYTFGDSTRPAALASITHPAFKLRWLSPDVIDNMMRTCSSTPSSYPVLRNITRTRTVQRRLMKNWIHKHSTSSHLCKMVKVNREWHFSLKLNWKDYSIWKTLIRHWAHFDIVHAFLKSSRSIVLHFVIRCSWTFIQCGCNDKHSKKSSSSVFVRESFTATCQ